MILPDVNLLIYAHNEDSEQFERANEWFKELLTGKETACFCWETINGFMRVSTNHRAMPNPISLQAAFSAIENWLDQPNVLLLTPTKDHLSRLRQIAETAHAKGPLFTDAILATLAITHNATIASTDRDFRLFDGLKLINPLEK